MFFYTLYIALFASLFVFCFGLFFILRSQIFKRPTEILLQLLHDGLHTLQLRITSAVLQFILYMTLAVYAGAWFLGLSISWNLWVSAWIGALITLFGTGLCLHLSSRMTQHILHHSTRFYESSITTILKAASGLSGVLFGLTGSGFILVIIAFGLHASVGFCVGVAATAVCIKTASSIFRSSSLNGLAISNRIKPSQPIDAQNPGSLLALIGNLASNLSGFLADLLTSFCLAFSSIFLFIGYILQMGPIQKMYFASFFVLFFTLMLVITPISLMVPFLRIRMKQSGNLLLEAIYVGIACCCLGMWALSAYFAPLIFPDNLFYITLPFLTGILGAALIGFTAEYLTTDHFPPTKYLANLAGKSSILATKEGLAYGFLSNGIYLCYLALIAVITFGYAGSFGLMLTTLGMVSVMGPVMAATAVSPIAESAHTIAKLSHSHTHVQQNLKRAAKLGTTTVALQSGFMFATSTLASASMIATLVSLPAFSSLTQSWLSVSPMAGFIVGLAIPYSVFGLILKRDRLATSMVIDEIHRQFEEIPFLADQKAKPDVVKAADKLARIANDSLILPLIVMTIVPIAVAFGFGSTTLLALAVGVFLSTTLSGYHWAITGDSLLQAKGYIENGHLGGSGTQRHEDMTTSGLIGTAFGEVLSPSSGVLMKTVTVITVLLMLFLSQ